MDGSATLTIATSRTTMNCAATITARAIQRRRSVLSAAVCVKVSELIRYGLQSLVAPTITKKNACALHLFPDGSSPPRDQGPPDPSGGERAGREQRLPARPARPRLQ